MTVRKKGDKYVLVSKSGRILGTHDTARQAHAQEAAIQHAKRRKEKGKHG